MTELYEAICPLVSLVRNGEGSDEEIARLFAPIDAAYQKAREGIVLASRP